MIYNYTISCIGFGEVGSTCANLLNIKMKGVLFNIVDQNDKISGRILDFSHACTVQNNEVICNDVEVLNESDFIIYAAGVNNLKGQSRYSVAHENKAIVNTIFSTLQLKSTAIIIVVTNPVELVSRWIYEALNQSNLVVGTGTSLDTFRLKYLLARNENIAVSEVQAMVIGEHGQYMTPVEAHTLVKGKKVDHYYSESQKYQLYSELKNSATKIRETEKATKYGVAACVELVITSFNLSYNTEIPLSVLINQSFQYLCEVEEPIFISLPCIVGNGNIQVIDIDKLELNNYELEALKQAAHHLQNEYFV